jgi:hypothetical protein
MSVPSISRNRIEKGFEDAQAIRSPFDRAYYLVTLAKIAEGDLFDKIVTAIVSLRTFPGVNGLIDDKDLQEEAWGKLFAFHAIFGILLARQSYERAFEFLPNIQSPRVRGEAYIILARKTVNDPLFEKVITAI